VRVLVLGGTEFVGPFLVRELLEGGHDVVVFHRGEHEHHLAAGAEHVHGDFADLERLLPGLRRRAPDVVVDMQAFRPADARRVLGFKGVAARGVVASSADVYRAFGRLHRTEPGEPDPVPLTEDSPLREVVIREDYDKVGVEQEAQSDPGFPVTIMRLPAIHGPGDYQHRLYEYVKPMDDGAPAIELERGLAGWRWGRGYVEDVAHALCLAATDERAAGRTYNVADPVAFSEREWVERIARVHGWDGEVVLVAKEQPYDLRQDYFMDSDRIRAELGYAEPTDADEAIARTIEWERANPPEVDMSLQDG
jgi:nucleoside-diphosphate-sugar epimerase